MKNSIGQSLVEYAVLLCLVAAVSCGSLQLLGQKVNTQISTYSTTLNGASGGNSPVNSVPNTNVPPAQLVVNPGTPVIPVSITQTPPTNNGGGNGNGNVLPPSPPVNNYPVTVVAPAAVTLIPQPLETTTISEQTSPPSRPNVSPSKQNSIVAQSNPDTNNTENAWGTVTDMCMGCSTLMNGNYGW